MALQDLLDLSQSRNKKLGFSPERIEAIKPALRQYIAFWREYPDLFVDFLQDGGDPTRKKQLKFYFYQRVFLRAAMRYRYVYAVYPRAYSKSFLSVLVLMVRCILYPGAKLFSTAGGKEQAASILKEKVTEICTLVPAFNREINWSRGVTLEGKDYCKYVFRNESYFDNVAAKESSRGKRRHSGLIEECVGVDGDVLQQVLIPMMNVSRRCLDGTVQENELLNQSQLYITTAGYKNSFSYEKLIQTLVQMLVEPGKAFIMGGTWRVPVLAGLQPRTFIQDLKNDSSFNEAGFQREYESKWSGSVEDAFFNGEKIDKNRKILKPEYEASAKSSKLAYYVLSIDVGRKGCQSVVCVFKVTPQAQGDAIKSLVNVYTYNDEHFGLQAINIKKLYYKYNPRRIVIDANGLGMGLMDYMVTTQTDPDTGDIFPGFGVYNDDEGFYKKFINADTVQDIIYAIKANAPINTEAYTIARTTIEAGRLMLLITEREAKAKLLGTVKGKNMTPEERNEYLMPHTLTDILKDEMMNLREENEGINIILKQANKAIRKDKFSALIYGLYYIKTIEEKRKKKKRFNASEWRFFTSNH